MSPAAVLSQKPSKRIKNTNCHFSMVIKISKDLDLTDSLTTLEWNHNHSVHSLQNISFKDIPKDIRNQIVDLFKSGLLPGATHRVFMQQLRSEYNTEIEYHQQLADRSLVPRRNDFNNLYKEYNRKTYGIGSLSYMFSALKERLETLDKDKGYSFAYQEYSEEMNQPFIVVIITPVMRRIHEMVSFDVTGV